MAIGPGRPAAFDREDALRRAVVVFWRSGYHGTSLPELLSGMGIARSSFYASFGSKHRVLLEALDLYTDALYGQVEHAASSTDDPRRALKAVLEVLACSAKPDQGCLFVNSVAELAPLDADVQARARRHLARVEVLLTRLLRRIGHSAKQAAVRGEALAALAMGAVMLRKGEASDAEVRGVLSAAAPLFERS